MVKTTNPYTVRHLYAQVVRHLVMHARATAAANAAAGDAEAAAAAAEPAAPPFGACFPEKYTELLAAKVKIAEQRFLDLGLPNMPEVEVFDSPTLNFRNRAEFRIWHDGEKMFYTRYSQADERRELLQFPMGSARMNELMPLLLAKCKAVPCLRTSLGFVTFLTTLSGECLITLMYNRQLGEDWVAAATAMAGELSREGALKDTVKLVGRARKQRFCVPADSDGRITESGIAVHGKALTYFQQDEAFTQVRAPSHEATRPVSHARTHAPAHSPSPLATPLAPMHTRRMRRLPSPPSSLLRTSFLL